MNFKVELQEIEEFYPTYEKWCKGHGFPSRRPDEIDLTFVCYNGNTPIYSVFFWRTPSTFCVLGFPFSNPDVPYDQREGGLQHLFESVAHTAKDLGFRIIWTTSDTERVVESLEETGFISADMKVDQYIKVLF